MPHKRKVPYIAPTKANILLLNSEYTEKMCSTYNFYRDIKCTSFEAVLTRNIELITYTVELVSCDAVRNAYEALINKVLNNETKSIILVSRPITLVHIDASLWNEDTQTYKSLSPESQRPRLVLSTRVASVSEKEYNIIFKNVLEIA